MQNLSVEAPDVVRCTLDDHAPLLNAMVDYKSYLNRMAYSILHHAEDAEDAVQAGYLSAWTSWTSFRGQSSLKTWLTTIVMNKALSELRTKRRKTWTSFEDDPALMVEAEWQMSVGQVTPEQHAMRAQTMRRVRELLAELPPQTRSVVMLRYGNDLSVEEIAVANGTTRGAVKSHLHRGRKAMRHQASRGILRARGR
jgi:RNA polymerase sigma-70 factor (ECF subfamily)